MKLKVFLLSVFFFVGGCQPQESCAPLSFEKYYQLLSVELAGDLKEYNKEYKNTFFINKNILGIFKLGDLAINPSEIQFDAKSNHPLLGVKTILNNSKKITAIAIYVANKESKDNTPSGYSTDFYTYQGAFGKPIQSKYGSYHIFDTEKAYLMLGVYEKPAYFVALISKSNIKGKANFKKE